eukprot:scaffold1672_cov75-Phaeocystis_antarctica.AAC.8
MKVMSTESALRMKICAGDSTSQMEEYACGQRGYRRWLGGSARLRGVDEDEQHGRRAAEEHVQRVARMLEGAVVAARAEVGEGVEDEDAEQHAAATLHADQQPRRRLHVAGHDLLLIYVPVGLQRILWLRALWRPAARRLLGLLGGLGCAPGCRGHEPLIKLAAALQRRHCDAPQGQSDADQWTACGHRGLGLVLLAAQQARCADECGGDGDDEDAHPLRAGEVVEQHEVLHHGDENDRAAPQQLPHAGVDREQPGGHERRGQQIEERGHGKQHVGLRCDHRLGRELGRLVHIGPRHPPSVGLLEEVCG